MTIQSDESMWLKQLFAIGAAGISVFLASGCAVQTTYTTDSSSVVPESQAKRDLGIDYLSAGRTAMAIRDLLASLSMDSSDPQTHLWLGEAYRRKGQTAKAEGYLNDALSIARRLGDSRAEQEAMLNLSALLSQMGRYEDALPHCEALALDPTFSTPWRPLSNCGWALMKLGRLAEARRHFEDALDFFPRYSPALLNLGHPRRPGGASPVRDQEPRKGAGSPTARRIRICRGQLPTRRALRRARTSRRRPSSISPRQQRSHPRPTGDRSPRPISICCAERSTRRGRLRCYPAARVGWA